MYIIHLEILAKNNILEQFEQEFIDKKILDEDKIFRPINSMSFEEFVEYLRYYGLALKEGIDITKARDEFNNINKLE